MDITEKLSKYNLSEKLQACMKMELQCADIYRALVMLFPGRLFPEAGDLFRDLAGQEERHADIIAIGIEFNKVDEVPDIIVPQELSMINLTLGMARDIKARLEAGNVTLKMALAMTLKMEESAAESYLNDIMKKQSDSEVISYLQQFYNDEKNHAEMIKDLMLEKGFVAGTSYN